MFSGFEGPSFSGHGGVLEVACATLMFAFSFVYHQWRAFGMNIASKVIALFAVTMVVAVTSWTLGVHPVRAPEPATITSSGSTGCSPVAVTGGPQCWETWDAIYNS